jgi:CRP/FNR family cyclic AMP-dependent transcriptional regulator
MQASRKKITKLNFTEIDPYIESLLKSIVVGKHLLQLQEQTPVFSQGDQADAIYFIQTGKVKLSVVSGQGKEAVLAMAGPREFFGEGCLVGQAIRITTATTTESSTVFRVQKQAMLQALHAQSELSDKFTAALLTRNIKMEEDLCDQLFNHSEKRLARVLLKLSRFGQHADVPDAKMPRLTHETLAEMVGTTRSRITFFMNKFRNLGLIEYTRTGELTVRDELMTDVVLHD